LILLLSSIGDKVILLYKLELLKLLVLKYLPLPLISEKGIKFEKILWIREISLGSVGLSSKNSTDLERIILFVSRLRIYKLLREDGSQGKYREEHYFQICS